MVKKLENHTKTFSGDLVDYLFLPTESEIYQNKIRIQAINEAIKKLYQTDYFEDIQMLIENEVLKISVIENPIIQTITINGIKNKSILDKINWNKFKKKFITK